MTTTKKVIPAIRRKKGGVKFPRISLKRAVEYAKKLVSRTHTGPQPATIILKGVFNNAHSEGKIRASALKQFDLLMGKASAYDATDLAKKINSAPAGEETGLLQNACLKPQLFRKLYQTFQGDTAVGRAKIKQQALQLDVHPDSGETAVAVFVESLLYAGLARDSNGDLEFLTISDPAVDQPNDHTPDNPPASEAESQPNESEGGDDPDGVTTGSVSSSDQPPPQKKRLSSSSPLRSQVQVSLNVDSTMDPEKLQKSLDLLRQYGVI